MAAWSERRLIEKIRQASKSQDVGLLKSIGDDCCEVVARNSFLISTDSLIDGIHFDRSFHPPKLLGRKTIAVNVSDIAAMGGNPRFVLLALCLPVDLEWDWISSWLDGVLEILDEFKCALIGGDTVKAKELAMTVTVLGEPLESGAIYRNTAGEGDTVWVSGPLGSAGIGLKILTHKKQYPDDTRFDLFEVLIGAHLDPKPQVALGLKLAESGLVTAMQDISDGIATDLAHICKASEVSAHIQADCLPFLPELPPAAALLNIDVEGLLLRSGEDYQLVFTVRRGEEAGFAKRFPGVVQIGKIHSGEGVFLQREDGTAEEITFQGYEH
ncbi:thiamine-phosphate kinase [Desulfocapsa sulfexigens DSM 10523]|uniref:Thiamine-monophosphate kinase n=1 Tax=Desulfocapsa sulfexigens (strain DSM 10523 / SB164P1) TaxID=1167006 RepID=M1PJK1_DESSD|nr:thiamine-phosphate kinase [Desulfocapsa sulfexigens]AGF79740.1 thiamine-phosphate kinase [Desulfocapsa sulfexigens DSM 10523]